MVIWFQAASSSKCAETPRGHSSRPSRSSVKRKKRSAQHKKHPAFQFRKNTDGKERKSETKVCCPECKKMLPGDDGLLDHFGRSPQNLGASNAEVGHAKAVSDVQCNGGEPALVIGGPEVSTDAPAVGSKKKRITHSKFNKFSHRKEADMERVDFYCRKLVGKKCRIKCNNFA